MFHRYFYILYTVDDDAHSTQHTQCRAVCRENINTYINSIIREIIQKRESYIYFISSYIIIKNIAFIIIHIYNIVII